MCYHDGMKFFAFLSVLVFFSFAAPGLAVAQDGDVVPGPLGEVTNEPLCARVVNHAVHNVAGIIRTELYMRPDGIKARHIENFKLQPGQAWKFCSTGPFFEGRKLEITVRTMVPLDACQSTMGGDIIIDSTPRPASDGGGYKVKVHCLE